MNPPLKFVSLTMTVNIAMSPIILQKYSSDSLSATIDSTGEAIAEYVNNMGAATVTRDGLTVNAVYDETQNLQENDVIVKTVLILEFWDYPGVSIDSIDLDLHLTADSYLLDDLSQRAVQNHGYHPQDDHPTARFSFSPHEGWNADDDGVLIPMLMVSGPTYSWQDDSTGPEIQADPLLNWRAHLPEDDYRSFSIRIVTPSPQNQQSFTQGAPFHGTQKFTGA